MNRIVVTGMGILSALGLGVDATLDSLRHDYSGVGALKYLRTKHADLPCAEVPFSNDDLKKMLSFTPGTHVPRSSLIGMLAIEEALSEAGLSSSAHRHTSFINGTTVGGMDLTEHYYGDLLSSDRYNDCIIQHECGACTEQIANRCSSHFSFITTLSTACSSAANALVLGANMLKVGATDVAVVGGTECLTQFHLNGFNTLMILDHEACRPFDESRAGLNLGEGAAYLVLEREEDALKRDAKPLAVLAGYANTCDAFHQTATSEQGEGIAAAMTNALSMAGLSPMDIDYINAHGTGTPNNDLTEARAMVSVFSQVPSFSSTKAMTGHTTSASGSIEAVISLLAIRYGIVPGNLRFEQAMKEVPLSVSSHVFSKKIRNAMSNSCGFGGNCTSLLFSEYKEGGME